MTTGWGSGFSNRLRGGSSSRISPHKSASQSGKRRVARAQAEPDTHMAPLISLRCPEGQINRLTATVAATSLEIREQFDSKRTRVGALLKQNTI
jgi:hypothetical protein